MFFKLACLNRLTLPHIIQSTVCVTAGCPSVRPSVCPIYRQQQRRAAGLLLSARACSRCQSVAVNAGSVILTAYGRSYRSTQPFIGKAVMLLPGRATVDVPRGRACRRGRVVASRSVRRPHRAGLARSGVLGESAEGRPVVPAGGRRRGVRPVATHRTLPQHVRHTHRRRRLPLLASAEHNDTAGGSEGPLHASRITRGTCSGVENQSRPIGRKCVGCVSKM